MKPLPLLAYPIKNSSAPNSVVLDPFGGSGSTLIACDQTDRICYTMELDPQYASVITQRFASHIGSSEGIFVERDGQRIEYAQIQTEQNTHVDCF